MRRFGILLLLATLTLGCENGGDSTDAGGDINPPVDENPVIEFTGTASHGNIHEIDSQVTNTTIEFEVDTPWELSFASYNNEPTDWISADKTSGQPGKHSVKLFMEPNATSNNRLVRVEIRDIVQRQSTRVEDFDMDDIINSYQGVCYVVSILQACYYADNYPIGVRVYVEHPFHLKELIDEYIEENNLTYDDIEYLEVCGDLSGDPIKKDSNYHFINNSLLNLKELNLSDADMVTIQDGAFSGNRSIHYIRLPRSLEYIGDNAFYNSELRNVNLRIPSGVRYVGYNAFAGTQISGTIVISNYSGYIELWPGAFNTPYILTAIFCEGITTIEGGHDAFQQGLALLVLPSSLRAIRQSFLRNISIVCCYAQVPPNIIDPILIQPQYVGGVLVPISSYLFYTDTNNPWSKFAILPAF